MSITVITGDQKEGTGHTTAGITHNIKRFSTSGVRKRIQLRK
jgi:hypothetical protein